MRRLLLAAAMVTGLATTGLGLSAGHARAEASAPDASLAGLERSDLAVLGQVLSAKAEFEQGDFVQVIQDLTPTIEASVYDDLSPGMKYEVLGLYARSLFSLAMWDDAHEALISLTSGNTNATVDDWAYRYVAAQKLGDDEDAALVVEHLLARTSAKAAPGA